MEIKIKHVLLTAGAIVLAYQGYKLATKPPQTSSASGRGTQRVIGDTVEVLAKDGRWVRSADQPKAMSWYNLNGKWVWVKWNGKLS